MYIGQSEKQRRKKMIAIFIAPFYIALNIYLFWRIKGWVQAYFPKLKGKKGWIVPIVLYAFLASALVIAFFLPGKVQTWHEAGGQLLAGRSAVYDIFHSDS